MQTTKNSPYWFARHSQSVIFLIVTLAFLGGFLAFTIPVSVFPATNFPRILVTVDKGVMPVDQMMVTVTRPIEEAVNSAPGLQEVRSVTSRGTAEVNLFFDWNVDMFQTLQYVNAALSRVQPEISATAKVEARRMTFASFPIIGYSLTSENMPPTQLWEMATYEIKPRLNRLDGVSSVLVQGGQEPEFHIVPDPAKLLVANVTVPEILEAIRRTNLIDSPGLLERRPAKPWTWSPWQSKTFWQAVSANTIMIAADTPGKRKDRQDNIMTTFYLRNVSTSSDLQDAANTIKGILDLSRIQLIPRQNAIVMRGTSDQLVLAQKLLSDIDKPKPEVVIDIVVMQIRRDKVRQLGTNLPASASVALVPGGGLGATGGGTFTINSLRNINATNFQVSIPGATLSALMTDGNTKIIQNPEIRALDSEKATLKIGDRVPIATGSFSGGGGASISPLVNTQFQYLDVGVNIDITPHIHPDHEVTLKMTLEISSVTGSQNLGGVTQPIIGQRRIEHEMRLHDGDINLVGGILEDSETQSISGYPGLLKVPILKYLFGQENKEMRENEIVFAITPHIVRGQDLNEQNLRMVDVGTGSAVGIRHKGPVATSASSSPAATPSQQSDPARTKEKAVPDNIPSVTPKKRRQSTQPQGTSPATQALKDPYPYGQHLVSWQTETGNCVFD